MNISTGTINRFLSLKPFVVLGRLTFVAFLLHYNVIKTVSAFYRQPVYYTPFHMAVTYVGILVTIYMLAAFIFVTIESPFANLMAIAFERAMPIKKDPTSSVQVRLIEISTICPPKTVDSQPSQTSANSKSHP